MCETEYSQIVGVSDLVHNFDCFVCALRPDNIISFILTRVNRYVGRNRDIPEKYHMTPRKQNLACLTCDPN